jgi:Spy/CpxP family protein refolding chaperone
MRIFLPLLVLLSACPLAFAQSPYAGQQDRVIKSLSSERMAGLESGRGLGYAKAAELNGYPGPKHVLELADELELSETQRARTRELFEAMQERAAALGRDLIAAEAALDEAFARRDISPERLAELVAASARIEGDLRRAHLEAHLDQAALLDDEQVARYVRLRGYAVGQHEHHHRHRN